jgi:hypothetical protein
VKGAHFDVAYHTRIWETGETIRDEWRIIVPQVPPGKYELRVGMLDANAQTKLPVTKNGTSVGDWIKIGVFTVLSE